MTTYTTLGQDQVRNNRIMKEKGSHLVQHRKKSFHQQIAIGRGRVGFLQEFKCLEGLHKDPVNVPTCIYILATLSRLGGFKKKKYSKQEVNRQGKGWSTGEVTGRNVIKPHGMPM